MTEFVTDGCKLYAAFEFLIPEQQIRIFSESTLSNLVALGQGNGVITLYERNGSGVSGTVEWDGIPVAYPSSAVLDCFASSSSSSSVDSSSSSSFEYSESSSSSSESSEQYSDSSSSSSEIVSSSSSSSSICCEDPICTGAACVAFSDWLLDGMRESNTTNCTLYARFEYFGISDTQQVELYKDENLFNSDLIAIGQSQIGEGGSPVIIPLDERNNSGLTGNVTWDGVTAASLTTAELSCF